MAPDYDSLTLLQKIEVFEVALENTAGQDLYKVLWLKSKNSEIWLERRTNYTRSLAVMSMVGYILGLGDRHPSNLMLDRYTGKTVHIDFGDCFEVAMHREKFPEKIPFRLTRMLINAMEVSGIEGNYRITCEHVMRVLRENKDSLMAVLEAFVYDPLLNWRLGGAKGADGGPKDRGVPNKIETDLLEEQGGPGRGATRKQRNENDLILAGMCGHVLVCLCRSCCSRFTDHPLPPPPSPATRRGQCQQAGSPEPQCPGRHQPGEQQAHRWVGLWVGLWLLMLVVVVGSSPSLLIPHAHITPPTHAGRDFKPHETLPVPMQVERLILQATSLENLCQCYVGWCSFW
jgi:phosphatidylinositol kinase/protein kinase (PI-3  family)